MTKAEFIKQCQALIDYYVKQGEIEAEEEERQLTKKKTKFKREVKI